MTRPSYGSVLTCIVVTSFLMAYLLILNKKKNFIFHYGTGAFLALTLLSILRSFLPCNFLFSHNILSEKILPPFFDVITYKLFGLFSLMNIFVITWIAGFLFQLVRLLINQYRFYQLINVYDTITSYNDILQKLMKRHTRKCNIISRSIKNHLKPVKIHIRKLPLLKSPCITGLIHPTILLPDMDFSEKETEYILNHELEHFYHHDLWIRLFCEIMVCMYWWNPLAYQMKKQLTAALEFSNDFSITKEMEEIEKLDYLDCLLKVSRNQPSAIKTPALSFLENGTSMLKQRQHFILNHNHGNRDKTYFINLSVIVTLILISFLFVVEPSSIPQEILDTTMSLDIDHTFLIENGQGYDVYFHNQYVGQAEKLDSFPGYTVYKNKKEAKQYEKIE